MHMKPAENNNFYLSKIKTTLVILTYNAGSTIADQLTKIKQQTHQPNTILLINSSSDNTSEIAKPFNPKIHTIPRNEFNHGNTRQIGIEVVDADIYIYMTQDAIPTDKYALENILKSFANSKVGCAYGRQLPHKNATTLAAHARLFNYPNKSIIKKYQDKNILGIKTCFNSDSFSAYRKEALLSVGGFPRNTFMGEDVIIAAKMLLKNWHVAYQADATVYHSHNHSLLQTFRRYFDIGVFHTENSWIIKEFSSPNYEGWKYIKSELKYCIKQHDYIALIKSIFQTATKLIGYKAGKICKKLKK